MSSGEKINKEVLDNIGFKINLGIDINKKTCSQKIKKDCKYLKSWSVHRKTFSREIVLRGKKNIIYLPNRIVVNVFNLIRFK